MSSRARSKATKRKGGSELLNELLAPSGKRGKGSNDIGGTKSPVKPGKGDPDRNPEPDLPLSVPDMPRPVRSVPKVPLTKA